MSLHHGFSIKLGRNFLQWVTEETIKLRKERGQAKVQASDLSKRGIDSSEAWKKYKTSRNRVKELTYKQH